MTDDWGELKDDPLQVIRNIETLLTGKSRTSTIMQTETALHHLIPLSIGIKRHGILDSELMAFRRKLEAFFNSDVGKAGLVRYVDRCDRYAMRGPTDGYETACGYRSVLQLLNDEFVPWQNIDIRFLQEDMEEIDDTLAYVAEVAPPPREHEIPDWATETHWWWRAPKNQDMSEEERAFRTKYEELEP